MSTLLRAFLILSISAFLYGGCKKSHGGGAPPPPFDPFVSSTGAIDSSFSADGMVQTQVDAADEYGNGVAIQGDGKIVVAGNVEIVSDTYFGVVRYNVDGSLDPTFDGDGRVITPFGVASDAHAMAVAIQSDGQIVVAGYASTVTDSFAAARYNSDGSLDTTFNGTGKVTLNAGPNGSRGYAMAIQGDGKIIMAGSSWNLVDNDFAIVRINGDGTPDLSFNGGGFQIVNVPGNGEAHAVTIDAAGRILAAGAALAASDFALVRLTSAGAPDTTLNTTGQVVTPILAGWDQATGVHALADGKILLTGYAEGAASVYDYAMARYNSDGSLDTTFDTDGKLTTTFGFNGAISYGSVLQPDGKILLTGAYWTGSAYVALTARYLADGTLDASFDIDGYVTSSVNGLESHGNAVALQPDGAIVVAGYAYNGTDNDFIVLRYHTTTTTFTASTGALDTTFDVDGKTIYSSLGLQSDVGRGLVIQPDGKFLVCGMYAGTQDFAIYRFNAEGTIDAGFGTGGYVTVNLLTNDAANAIALMADGRIVVVGDVGPPSDFGIVRLNPDGTPDTTFDGDGMVTIDPGSGLADSARAVAIQPNGRIVVAGGSANGGGNYDFSVVRLNIDGSPDTTFSGDGKATQSIGAGNDFANAVAIQADRKIIIGGEYATGIFQTALVRFNENGTIDTSFDTDGIVTTAAGTNYSRCRGLLVQPDGKIVSVGYTDADQACLIRYTTNGSLDTTFDTGGNSDGIVQSTFGFNGSQGYCASLQPDGKIVLGGAYASAGAYISLIARYTSAGVLDTTFDADGFVTNAIQTESYLYGIAVQTDGAIVGTGYSYVGGNSNVFLVRYH